MFSHALVDKGVTFANDFYACCGFCCTWCPLDVIYDYGKYFEMSFSVITGYFAMDPSLIARSSLCLVGHQRI